MIRNKKGQFIKGVVPWNKGKKMIGYKNCGFQKGHKAMGGHQKGDPISEETKKKLSKALIGRKKPKFSEQHKKNISKSLRGKYRGEKSQNWKGGLTPLNQKLRHSAEAKEWKTAIFERDGFVCMMPGCNGKERYLHAHHIKKWADYKELRYEVSNGITLCKNCHNKTRRKEEHFEDMFFTILKAMYGGKEF